MSLEEFLNPARPGWRIQEAYALISDACNILVLVEKGKYLDLSEYVEKKDSYLKLLNELEELLHKHKLQKWVSEIGDSDESIPDDFVLITRTKEEFLQDRRNQTICHYFHQLDHADKLVARDKTWTACLRDSD